MEGMRRHIEKMSLTGGMRTMAQKQKNGSSWKQRLKGS